MHICKHPSILILRYWTLDSAAKRISIMGICNKLAWPIPAIFIVWLLGKDVSLIGIEDLSKPFIIIICAFVALGVMAFFAPLPEVKAAGEDESEDEAEACPYAASKTSVFSSRTCCWAVWHCSLCSVETVSLGTLVDYAKELGLEALPTTHGLLLSVLLSAISAVSSLFRNTSARQQP